MSALLVMRPLLPGEERKTYSSQTPDRITEDVCVVLLAMLRDKLDDEGWFIVTGPSIIRETVHADGRVEHVTHVVAIVRPGPDTARLIREREEIVAAAIQSTES